MGAQQNKHSDVVKIYHFNNVGDYIYDDDIHEMNAHVIVLATRRHGAALLFRLLSAYADMFIQSELKK